MNPTDGSLGSLLGRVFNRRIEFRSHLQWSHIELLSFNEEFLMMLIDKLKCKLDRRMKAPDNLESVNSNVNLQFLSSVFSESAILLDCGCGEGKNIVDIEYTLPHKIIGLDIDYPTVLRCRRNVSNKVILICGNGLDIPLRDNTFDGVISNQVIEHIPQYEQYLSEIARVLKLKGFLIISTPNAHCPKNTFLRLLGQKPILRWSNINNLPAGKFRGHTQEFTEEELIQILARQSFTLLNSCPILPHPTLHGNWLFNIYSVLEFVFFLLFYSFVSKGYSKNSNMIFQLTK